MTNPIRRLREAFRAWRWRRRYPWQFVHEHHSPRRHGDVTR